PCYRHTSPSSLSSNYSVVRYLHSFPTRRSSDLEARQLRQAEREDDDAAREHGAEHGDGLPVPRALRERTGEGRGQRERHQIAARDRKSTRLNSSHGSISYAVFCLKKKTSRSQRRHARDRRRATPGTRAQ